MSIKNKILFLLVFSIGIITAISSSMSYFQAKNALENNHEVTAMAQLERVQEYLNKFIQDANSVLGFLANSELIINADNKLTSYATAKEEIFPRYDDLNDYEKLIYSDFKSFHDAFPYYQLIYLGTKDGSFVQAPDDPLPAGYDPTQRSWYIDAVKSPDKFVFSEGYVSTTNNIVYSIMKAVQKNNEIQGVVAIDVEIKDLSSFFKNIHMGETGYLLVMEENGMVVADSQDADMIGQNIKDTSKSSLASLLTQQRGNAIVKVENVPYIASYITTDQNWKLVLLIQSDEITGAAWDMTRNTMFISLVCALILVGTGFYSAHTITAPINILVHSVQRISEGDFEALPKNAHYSGEIQVLYKSLTSMTKQLAELIQTSRLKSEEALKSLKISEVATQEANEAKTQAMEAHAEGMHQAAGNLMQSVNVIVNATHSLSQQINTTEEKVNTQAYSVTEAADIVEDINATIQDVARNASEAAEASSQTRVLAQDGQQTVQSVVNMMEKIEDNAISLKKDMEELNTQTVSISQIMNIISDIADQTNLLALNAAIEAARAGEAGRGFAVVADEVRKLAEKTMNSTTQVGSAIQAIQRSVESNLKQVDSTVDNIESAAVEAKNFHAALNEILNMANTSHSQVSTIAQTSMAQSGKSQQMHQSITYINTTAQETAEIMTQAAQAVAELTQQAEILNKLIDDMKKV